MNVMRVGSQMEQVFRDLALAAGDAILQVYARADLGVQVKADASPVTEADLAADAVIRAGLAQAFPDIPVVTEEQADSHDLHVARFIIVDPLDGTKEFVQRRGDFTVNIALVENGVPVRGVVYAPAKGRLFYTRADGASVEEMGPFIAGQPGEMRVLRMPPVNMGAVRVVASKSHRDAETDAYIAQYSVADLVSAGSSLKFCLLACGEADLYPRFGPTMEWDTAAGDAVLRGAAGQIVTLPDYAPFVYGKAGFRNTGFVAFGPMLDLAQR
jgi:3'(2'), 5'-bisphosphate nucleotidase